MANFKHRINPDSTELERYFLSVYTGQLWDALEKIKDWHSPEHIEKEVQMKLLKLQQQALPVVPECVAEWIVCVKEKNNNALALLDDDNMPDDVNEWLFFQRNDDNINLILRAWLDGFTVEKPQLFRVCLLDGRHTLTRRDPRKTLPFNYTFLWSYSSELKEMREINKEVDLFTEEEIKSIDERYWQFAVPVEDEE